MNSSSTLPTGTVTFLFTDIEGSTRLLQQLGGKYATLLARQRKILRAAFEKRGGQEVDTQGDAFFVSFLRAGDALEAVVEAQRQLTAHPWPDGVEVRVRMGLHTGEPLLADEGYVGLDVHRAARLAHAAHGGQVLLSPSTAALVAQDLPEGISLQDLGEHQLKDLRQPIRIHQLDIAGMPVTFPPLSSLHTLPNNLPVQFTSFVGRSAELLEVKNLLNKSRLVTLIGPGGTGKTRLSLQVAADMVDAFPNGVWFVELEPVDSPSDLVPAVATALQFSIDAHSSDLNPKRQLLDYLGQRALLLVLDNFEHLVEGADLLSEMLTVSPETRFMVTSRERLNLREEWVYPLNGLRYPKNGNGTGGEVFSGLALFLERARQVLPDCNLTKEDLPSAIRICQLVEGMPLGIELAAAWVGILSCREIEAEIERNMDFLATTMRGVPDKHRSLRAVFDQSWGRLTAEQRVVFRKLAVFQGGFTREAASVVSGVSLPMLLEFSQKSLLRRDDRGRFEMHALLKAFAEEKLDEFPDERMIVQQRHSRYFVEFLADRQDRVQGERMLALREEVRAEIGNVRAAINRVVTDWEEDEASAALRSLSNFAQTEGFYSARELYRHLAKRLRDQGAGLAPGDPRRGVLLNVLMTQAVNGAIVGDPEAVEILDKCLPMLRELDLPYELGLGLLGWGISLEYQGKFQEAIQTLAESLTLLESYSFNFLTAAVLSWLGWAHYELGAYDRAGELFHAMYMRCKDGDNILGLPYALSKMGTWADALQAYERGLGYHQEAQKYFEAIGDQAGQGYALSRMSLSAWGMEAYEKALAFGKAGFEQFNAIGHRWGIATSLGRIGFAELAVGRVEEARAHFFESLERGLAYKYPSTANYAMIGLGNVLAADGEIEKAIEILTHASEDSNTPALYRDIVLRALAKLESGMSPEAFANAQERARSIDYEAIINDIRNLAGPLVR